MFTYDCSCLTYVNNVVLIHPTDIMNCSKLLLFEKILIIRPGNSTYYTTYNLCTISGVFSI